jgi:hypothetical protein
MAGNKNANKDTIMLKSVEELIKKRYPDVDFIDQEQVSGQGWIEQSSTACKPNGTPIVQVTIRKRVNDEAINDTKRDLSHDRN